MAIHSTPKVTALQAQATANLFLSDCLPDRFTADQPQLNTVQALYDTHRDAIEAAFS